MKKFKFGFERLLKVKLILESKTKRELSTLISHRMMLEDSVRELEHQKIITLDEIRCSKTVRGMDSCFATQILSGLQFSIRVRQSEIENVGNEIDRIRQELLELMKERKVLESLKDKKFAEYLKETGRVIDTEANDLFLLRSSHV